MRTTLPTASFLVRSTLMLSLLFGLLALALPRSAFAAGVVGNGSAASCTEAALQTALNAGGAITFNCGSAPVTILLTRQLELKKDATVDGANLVTLSGQGRVRVLYMLQSTATLRNLTIRDGYSDKGGAVRAVYYSNLTVQNVKFYNNDSTAGRDEEGGGAISMHGGTLRVENSHFEGNRGINGGAIHNLLCPATIINSTFVNNDSTAGGIRTATWDGRFGFGGAVYTDGASPKDSVAGQLVIRNSTFTGNKARNHGGAVYTYLYAPDTALIEGSHFADNQVFLSPGGRSQGGALVHHQGPLTLRNSTFVNNSSELYGGAMMIAQNQSDAWSQSTISNVTISGNRVDDPKQTKGLGGGLFVAGGQVTVQNSTLAGNYADTLGGGIYSQHNNVRLRNTIIAGNRAGNGSHPSQQCYLTFGNSAANLQSPGSGTTKCSSDVIMADPQLAAPASNGGRTMTMALPAGSPAIDRGGADCLAADQRGAARVGRCDIGAFEYGATAPSPEGMTAPSLEELAPAGAAVRAAWSMVPGAQRYEVQVTAKSGLTVQFPNLNAVDERLALVLDPGSYDFQVRACNDEGCGPYSNTRSVTIDVAPEKVFLPQLMVKP